MKSILAEFLTGLDELPATARRLRVGAWVRLLAVVPVIMGPTLARMFEVPLESHAPAFLQGMVHAWMGLVAIYLAANLAILLLPRQREDALRALTYTCIAIELGTNQISLLLVGSLISHALLFVVLTVAVYRVVTDYALARFATALGVLLFIAGGVLELTGAVPLTSAFAYPVQHPHYGVLRYGVMAISMGSIGVLLTFVTVNFGVNQSVKLHRYITEAVLRRYLPPSLVREAARGELSLDAPPERRVVTVLFADLVDFTPMSEAMEAEELAALLNRYLALVTTLAHQHGATVDKFIGDAAMLVLGAPDRVEPAEQVRRAVDLAWDIQLRVGKLEAPQFLRARIGIETGEALMGNFGSEDRSDFTVLGRSVIIASRLEGRCEPGRVLVGPETARLLGAQVPRNLAGELSLQGIERPVTAWYVRRPRA